MKTYFRIKDMSKLITTILILFTIACYSQETYQLYSLRVIENDSILYNGDWEGKLVIDKHTIKLMENGEIYRFNIANSPVENEDYWQNIKADENNKLICKNYIFRLYYLDDVFKDKIKFEADGEERVIYSVILETNHPNASNHRRFSYAAYKTNE
jgi:homogentisate 1,2-dioxygenase